MALRMATPVRDKFGTYYCRVGVPAELRDIIGKRELKRSLRTKDPNQAKVRFGPVYSEFCKTIENARRQLAGEPLLTSKDIEILAERWLMQAVDETEQKAKYRDWFHWSVEVDPITGQEYRYADSPILWRLNEGSKHGNEDELTQLAEEVVGEDLKGFLKENQIALPSQSAEYKNLLLRASAKLRELIEHTSARERGRYTEPVTKLANQPLSTERAPKGLTVLEAWEAFLKKLAREEGEKTAQRRGDDYRASVFGLAEFLGNPPINTITAENLKEYRDFLYSLPKRPSKAIKQLPIKEQANEATKRGLETLSRLTVRNRMVHCSALFNAALDMPGSGLTRNPMEGVKLPSKITRADSGRKYEIQPDSLPLIFGGDWFNLADYPRRNRFGLGGFWIPLITYYCGARLEEVAAMNAADIRKVQDVWVLEFRFDGQGRELKNLQSVRSVPIHKDLLQLGLADYANRVGPDGKLWPSLRPNPKGKYGYNLSKRFGVYLEEIGAKKSSKPMHGFRHLFPTLMREIGYDDITTAQVLGHSAAPRLQTSSYGTFSLHARRRIIDELQSLPNLEGIKATLAEVSASVPP